MLVCSPLLTSHKWREPLSSGRLVCRCHDVFLWCYLCFILLRFRLYAFVEAAALRSIVLRYAGAPIATRVSFVFFLLFNWRDAALSEYFLYHCRFLFVRRVRRTFFPSGWSFSTFVTTGWIFYFSLCESSINSKENIYGCRTWTFRQEHNSKLRTVRHRVLLCIIGAQRKRQDHRVTSGNRALEITRWVSIERTLRMRRLLWTGGRTHPNERRAVAKANHARKP